MKQGPILFFDGVCNLCSSIVQFIIKYELKEEIMFCSLQDEAAKSYISSDKLIKLNTVYVFEPSTQKLYSRSQAIFFIMNYLRAPWSYAKILQYLPRCLTDFGYHFVAKNRYKIFGKKEICETPNRQISHRFLS